MFNTSDETIHERMAKKVLLKDICNLKNACFIYKGEVYADDCGALDYMFYLPDINYSLGRLLGWDDDAIDYLDNQTQNEMIDMYVRHDDENEDYSEYFKQLFELYIDLIC